MAAPSTLSSPRSKKSGPRRILRWLGAVVAVVSLLSALWLLDLLRPREAHFRSRHGKLEAAHVQEDANAPVGLRSMTVRARADTGLEVSFRVLRPAGVQRPLPLIVLLGGHRTGSRAVELVGNPGPFVVAALDYPYDGPEKIRGVREALTSLPTIQRALLDTPPAVSLALDWLLDQSWVDPRRAELAGVSLGTPFATVAGALDDRFRRVWILHGGADNREWLENTLERRIPSRFLRAPAARLLHLLAHGASFDTEKWVARIAPRPVVIVGAKQDESLSHENVTRLYAAAGEPRELLWTEGGHVQTSRAGIVRELLDIVRDRLPDGPAELASTPPAGMQN